MTRKLTKEEVKEQKRLFGERDKIIKKMKENEKELKLLEIIIEQCDTEIEIMRLTKHIERSKKEMNKIASLLITRAEA